MPDIQYVGTKQPSEEYYLKFDYSRLLREANAIAAATSAIDLADDSDVTNAIIDKTKQYVYNKCAYVFVQGGTDGHSYKITCSISATDGSRYELECVMPVEEL